MSVPPVGLPPAALVSLWKHGSDTDPSNFLCGGVFVGNGLVLTVKHVFAGLGSIWIRPHAGATQAFHVSDEPIFHPELDAALIRIAVMPTGCACAAISRDASFDDVNHGLTLNGYFKGTRETPKPFVLTMFDPAAKHFVVDEKHPVGHSGSGVAHAGRLWGLAVAHYLDPNTHRGCVISIGQLWPGWLDMHLPTAPADSPHNTSPHTAPKPPPGQAHAAVLARLKAIIDKAFANAAWQQQNVIPFNSGLPATLAKAITSEADVQGERCVKALHDLSRDIAQALRQRDLDAQTIRPSALRPALFEAMGCAVKLCLDLDAAPDAAEASLMWDIAADSTEGATVVARSQPEKSWLPTLRGGLPALADPHAITVPIELGEGEDAQRELVRLAHASVSRSGEVPREITPEIEGQVRGQLHHEADEGRARFLILPAKDRHKFSPELCAWARKQGLGLIALQGNDGRLFLYAEELLLAKLQAFVRLFDDHPDWKL